MLTEQPFYFGFYQPLKARNNLLTGL